MPNKRSRSKNSDAAIFDVDGMDFSTPESGSDDKFNPDPKNGVAGVYKASVRFILFLEDKEKSMITKFVAYLENLSTNESRAVDSYRSIKKEKDCPIVQTFFKLYKEEDASLKMHDRMFVQKETHYALVQVLEDNAKPENVGKIMWWRFGQKIKEKFDAEVKPAKGKGVNPFHIFDGRPLSIEVYKKGKHNNYDKCYFYDPEEGEPGAILIDGEPLTEDMDLGEAANWIKENSPDIRKFEFQEWDDNTRNYVNGVIESIYGTGSSEATAALVEVQDVTEDDDEDFDDEINEDVKAVNKKKAPAKKRKAVVAEVEEDDEEDDLFDDDDIDIDDIDFDDDDI